MPAEAAAGLDGWAGLCGVPSSRLRPMLGAGLTGTGDAGHSQAPLDFSQDPAITSNICYFMKAIKINCGKIYQNPAFQSFGN